MGYGGLGTDRGWTVGCTGMVRMCENAGYLGMLQNNAHGGVTGEKSFHALAPCPGAPLATVCLRIICVAQLLNTWLPFFPSPVSPFSSFPLPHSPSPAIAPPSLPLHCHFPSLWISPPVALTRRQDFKS